MLSIHQINPTEIRQAPPQVNMICCFVSQGQHATAAPNATSSSSSSSSKKSAKKAAKSAKKQAKQQQPMAAASTSGERPAASTCRALLGAAHQWAAVVLKLAWRNTIQRAALLDGWQLLDWLEVGARA
jgi:hypothetical protein